MKMRYPKGILAACLLPWTTDWELDGALFKEHLGQVIDLGYVDLYVMGTAGEGYALSDKQFEQVVRIFARETSRPGLRPQVGIISLSTRQIIDRIGFCRELGIRMFQISLPSWGALNDNELMVFFQSVCGSHPDCQFLHYNLTRSKRVLSGADYRRIADVVPNLAATKNSTSDHVRVADLMRLAPDLQHFFVENAFAFGTLSGECSLLCSFGLLFPKATRRWYEASQHRDLDGIWRFHQEFAALARTLFSHVTTQHIDGAFDKVLAWLANPRFPTSLLPPYSGLSEEDKTRVREKYEIHCKHLS